MSNSVSRVFCGSGSRVAYLKTISLEASFSYASDGAIDKLQSVIEVKHGQTLFSLEIENKSFGSLVE